MKAAENLGRFIIDAATGEILRTLTINPNRLYHGTGRPPGPAKK